MGIKGFENQIEMRKPVPPKQTEKHPRNNCLQNSRPQKKQKINRTSSRLVPGAKIEAKWKDGYFYNATIKEITKKGYRISYYQFGEEEEITLDRIKGFSMDRIISDAIQCSLKVESKTDGFTTQTRTLKLSLISCSSENVTENSLVNCNWLYCFCHIMNTVFVGELCFMEMGALVSESDIALEIESLNQHIIKTTAMMAAVRYSSNIDQEADVLFNNISTLPSLMSVQSNLQIRIQLSEIVNVYAMNCSILK